MTDRQGLRSDHGHGGRLMGPGVRALAELILYALNKRLLRVMQEPPLAEVAALAKAGGYLQNTRGQPLWCHQVLRLCEGKKPSRLPDTWL